MREKCGHHGSNLQKLLYRESIDHHCRIFLPSKRGGNEEVIRIAWFHLLKLVHELLQIIRYTGGGTKSFAWLNRWRAGRKGQGERRESSIVLKVKGRTGL